MKYKYYNNYSIVYLLGISVFIYSFYKFIKFNKIIDINYDDYNKKKYRISLINLHKNINLINTNLLNYIPHYINFEIKYKITLFGYIYEIKKNVDPEITINSLQLTIKKLLSIDNISIHDFIYFDDNILQLFPETLLNQNNIYLNKIYNNDNFSFMSDICSLDDNILDVEQNDIKLNNWNIVNENEILFF